MTALPRLHLAQLPTPLQRFDRLSGAWGGPTIWVKRDDLTGFGVSGNKVRKLEFHLAAALEAGARTVVTCGAIQSNHCRATALAAAPLGLDVVLFLRTADGLPPATARGNHLLHRISGARMIFIDPDQYESRDDLMREEAEQIAATGSPAWVIPEGASDPLGMHGFVVAMEEIATQCAAAEIRPAVIWHAASSAGTTAGLGWGADRLGLDTPIVGTSVGDTRSEIVEHVSAIWRAAAAVEGGPLPHPVWEITDRYVGGGYGLTTPAEFDLQAQATRFTGLLFDPTYTGKALYGLWREIDDGRYGPGDDVVFWHTGGGFSVFAYDFELPIEPGTVPG